MPQSIRENAIAQLLTLKRDRPITHQINGMNPGASPGWYFAPRGGECTQKDLFNNAIAKHNSHQNAITLHQRK